MATQNVILSKNWKKIADSSDDPVLIQTNDRGVKFQVATMDSETDPIIDGHVIHDEKSGITRSIIGAGHIYAKSVSTGWRNPLNGDIKLVVSGSSETLEV